MNAELRKVIQRIRENTGIELSVFTGGGHRLVGECPSCPVAAEGIVQNESGYTYFTAVCAGEPYVFALEGAGETQKNYAYLLAGLVENAGRQTGDLPQQELLRRILLGECAAEDVRKYCAKYSVPNRACCALYAAYTGDTADVAALLSQYAESEADFAVALGSDGCAFVRFIDESSEYPSAADFAQFLARSMEEELGIGAQIGVGCDVRNFEQIARSFRQASAALRMSGICNSKGRVHTYREFMLIKMLEDLPAEKRAEYLAGLLDGDARDILDDEEMINTAEEFLENNLNVSETSRTLYMHRNTLMYRLDKLERVTGLNLRKFSDAVTFRVITILNRLV